MSLLITIYALILGFCVGSFLNVLIYRLPLGLNPAKGSSFCPTCNHQLHARDLIPVFSFLFLKGKCRYCSEKISYRYPLIELVTGFLYTGIVYKYSISALSFQYIILVSILLVIVMIDYDKLTIPPSLTIVILAINTASLIFLHKLQIIEYLFSAFLIIIPFLLSSLISKLMGKKPFGMGDIKLLFALGLSVPFSNIYYFILLTFNTMFVKIILLIVKKDMTEKKNFAFSDVIFLAYILFVLL